MPHEEPRRQIPDQKMCDGDEEQEQVIIVSRLPILYRREPTFPAQPEKSELVPPPAEFIAE
jgi:hypothetical protein